MSVPILRVLVPAFLVLALTGCLGGGGDDDDDDDDETFSLFGGGNDNDNLFAEGDGGDLSESQFLDAFDDVYCAEANTCGASCGENPWEGTCNFDSVAAELCLEGTFDCRESSDGGAWVSTPFQCSEVYAPCG